MRRTFGRVSRLAALGAGVATAAAIALSASGPALADTTDTGGTATITFSLQYLEHLAKAGILVLPGAPASGSYATGFYNASLTVTGGNAEVNNFFGALKIGGNVPSTQVWDGPVEEIVFCNDALTPTQRIHLDQYLYRRWIAPRQQTAAAFAGVGALIVDMTVQSPTGTRWDASALFAGVGSLASAKNDCPAGVSSTPRACLRNRLTPSSRSSA